MLNGTFSIGPVDEETVCRSSKDYRFTKVGKYKIHSTMLMPDIPFGEATETPQPIDKTIFINDSETKLDFPTITKVQNYFTTDYIGEIPLEYYPAGYYTPKGHKFTLLCRDGNCKDEYRLFGTKKAVHGYGYKK